MKEHYSLEIKIIEQCIAHQASQRIILEGIEYCGFKEKTGRLCPFFQEEKESEEEKYRCSYQKTLQGKE